MLQMFFGSARQDVLRGMEAAADKTAAGFCGGDGGVELERVDGEGLSLDAFVNLFSGVRLFSATPNSARRCVLVRRLASNKEVWSRLPDLLSQIQADPDVLIILLEIAPSKASATFKLLKGAGLAKEIAASEGVEEIAVRNATFSALDLALAGKVRELAQALNQLELSADPYMFLGLLASQVLRATASKRLSAARTREVARVLNRADLAVKTSGTAPWGAVRIALMRIAAG